MCVCKTLIINVRLYETGHVGSQEKMGTLEAQVKQLGLQAAQECERMVKDRTLTLQLLQKVSTSAYTGGIYLKVVEEVCRSFTTENIIQCLLLKVHPCWFPAYRSRRGCVTWRRGTTS